MPASIVTLKNGQNDDIQYPKTVISALMDDSGNPLLPIIEGKAEKLDVGDKTNLTTTNKTNLVSAINENVTNIATNGSAINVLNDKLPNKAGAHNSIFRGKYLGTSVTTTQYTAISSGTFEDLYIGDYWTIGGVNWRIAGFNYYYNVGDTVFTTNHAVIVPDTILYNTTMNATDNTTGAYALSLMRTTNLASAISTIEGIFGTHLKTHKEILANAVTTGKASGWAWYDCKVELMNEQMVYGASAWGESTYNNGYQVGSSKQQLPLFSLNPQSINTRQSYWLRDVVSATNFARASHDGGASTHVASESFGVRPAFCIS